MVLRYLYKMISKILFQSIIVVFLIKFGGYVNILSNIKVGNLVLIKWSYMSP